MRVDDYGYIKVPFVGRLRAAGHTAAELQAMIQNGLRGMSQDPQVMVSIEQSITNSIILAGEIAQAGPPRARDEPGIPDRRDRACRRLSRRGEGRASRVSSATARHLKSG